MVAGVLAGGAAALAEETGTPVAAEEGGAAESGLLGKAADFQGKDIDGKTVSLLKPFTGDPVIGEAAVAASKAIKARLVATSPISEFSKKGNKP